MQALADELAPVEDTYLPGEASRMHPSQGSGISSSCPAPDIRSFNIIVFIFLPVQIGMFRIPSSVARRLYYLQSMYSLIYNTLDYRPLILSNIVGI